MRPGLRTSAFCAFSLLLLLPCTATWSRQSPGIPHEDRIRLAEAFRVAGSAGDTIWPGWSRVPFALMLITPDDEFLLRHPHATNNFDTLGFDAELGSKILFRRRLFPTNLLATFPAINGLPTVVVGQSANTGVTSSTAWVLTILHEHFHQYQQSQSDYFSSTKALGLSHGDETGMWMLNYPFPYGAASVDSAYAEAARSLLRAITCGREVQEECARGFLASLGRPRKLLSRDDYKYLSFQCWQEGVARYTELRVAEAVARDGMPGTEFRALSDFRPYGDVADSIRSNILGQLAHPSLAGLKRVAFYSLGAGEALLLDKVAPGWKRNYFRDKFHLEKNFPQ